MRLYSYHVFLFPFQWELKDKIKEPFGDRFDLNSIRPHHNCNWRNITDPIEDHYITELYNEKNFFYKFVHNVLYDTGKVEYPTIRHYERNEAYRGEMFYEIGVKADGSNVYRLGLKSIGLDLFSTGTGMLIFYLENKTYPEINDVKRINQFGRRIFPPFLSKDNGVDGTKNVELADYISLLGLSGNPQRYFEDFNAYSPSDDWKPASFITSLLEDMDTNIQIDPVVDDRMFTMCWYFDDELDKTFKDNITFRKFISGHEWHEYLFVDTNESTCQNDQMQRELLEKHSYKRWQKRGTLYGITRHSFMAISGFGLFPENILLTNFRTIYVRMTELALLQRSSILKFSSEVTRLSTLTEKDTSVLAENIGKFYRSYIRFVNQVYFREITAQEQGIEMYDILLKNLHMNEQVRDLDNEISELHNYAILLDEKAQGSNLHLLTILGSLFLIPSFIVGFYGMNLIPAQFSEHEHRWILVTVTIVTIIVSGGLAGAVMLNRRDKKKWANGLIIIIVGIILSTLAVAIFNNF